MLLEVLLSLGLLIFGMAVVGMQIQSGLQMAEKSDLRTRAVMLMETKYAELESGVLVPQGYDDEMTGGFGIDYPGFAWRMLIQQTDVEELYQVQMQIWFSEKTRKEQLDDPEMEVDYEEDGMRQVMSAYRLYAKPATVDLERDFGVPQDALEELSTQVPIPGFDPNNIDPRQLSQLDPEILQDLMPMLEQIFGKGADINSINDLSQDQRNQLRDAVNGRSGRAGRGGRAPGGLRGNRRGGRGDQVDGTPSDGREGAGPGQAGQEPPDRGGRGDARPDRSGRSDDRSNPRFGDRDPSRRSGDRQVGDRRVGDRRGGNANDNPNQDDRQGGRRRGR